MKYGTSIYTNEPVEVDRRSFRFMEQRFLCGSTGLEREAIMQQEMMSVLSETNDKIVIICDGGYDEIAKAHGEKINIDDFIVRSGSINYGNNSRCIVLNMEKVSDTLKSKAFRLCFETAEALMSDNYKNNIGNVGINAMWLYVDTRDIVKNNDGIECLYNFAKKSRKHGCTVTWAVNELHLVTSNIKLKMLFDNAVFYTFLHLSEKDRQIVNEIFRMSDDFTYNHLGSNYALKQTGGGSEFFCGHGIHILSDDGREIIPFRTGA